MAPILLSRIPLDASTGADKPPMPGHEPIQEPPPGDAQPPVAESN